MAQIEKGHHFLSGFGNNDYLEDYLVKPGMKLQPSANVSENEKRYKIEIGVPGVSKKELLIKRIDNELIVVGHKQITTESDEKGFKRREFNYNDFRRTFYIPTDVDLDKIKADFNDGMLEIALPKKGSTRKPREVEIDLS